MVEGEIVPMNGGYLEGVFWIGFSYGQVYPEVTASISGLTVAHGVSMAGGGILNFGSLTLNDCTLRDNYAQLGGAVINAGTLDLVDCTLSNNTAVTQGGAIVNGLPYSGDVINTYFTLTRCTLTDNTVTGSGYESQEEGGGAIFNIASGTTSALSIEESTLAGNSAPTGGAIFNVSLTDKDTGPPCIAEVSILRSSLSDNSAVDGYPAAAGGAIYQISLDTKALAAVTVDSSTLEGNSAQGDWAFGGAIQNGSSFVAYGADGGSMTIRNSTLTGNSALSGSLAVSGVAVGGAICQMAGLDTPATVTVDSCTLNNNTATSSFASVAGAIMNYSGSAAKLIVRNSTLANNAAVFAEGTDLSKAQGALCGALGSSGGMVIVDNCTLNGNHDDGPADPDQQGVRAGGIIVGEDATLTLKNTILANDPSGPNLAATPDHDGYLAGIVTDLGWNLATDDPLGPDLIRLLTATTDQVNTDPMLGDLQDNGGPTWTCDLLPGSPAIDMADATDSAGNPVEFDQRGVARPFGSANDIGAFELDQMNQPPILDVSSAPATGVAGVPVSFQATATDPDAGDTLTYSLSGAPAGAAIDPDTGEFTWTPLFGGAYTFGVTVTAAGGLSDTRSVTVQVTALEVSVASVARRGKSVTVTVRLANRSTLPVAVAAITSASLGGSPTTSSLPVSAKVIKPGASKSISLTFSGSAVPAGGVILSLQGFCVPQGFFSYNQMVTVP